MVLPWYQNGSLRDYLRSLRKRKRSTDQSLIKVINNWVSHLLPIRFLALIFFALQLYQSALGLEYLHHEGIVHGDLHAGNILIDRDGNACLTDFGTALLVEATAYNYASTHGGGAVRWQAPEIIDPEVFGLESTRPTMQSDIFSFACTAVEVRSSESYHTAVC